MDGNHTQHQTPANASDDQDGEVHRKERKELNHDDGQVESNSLENEPVDTEKGIVSVMQGKGKEKPVTSVPAWRVVSMRAVA